MTTCAQLLQMLVGRLELRSERGASGVEYGLLITGIAGVMVAALFLFGDVVGELFTTSCDTVTSTVTGRDC